MCRLEFDEGKLPPPGDDEELGGDSAIQDYLGLLPAAEHARRAGKPLMVYFYVNPPKPVEGKKVKPSRQSTACANVGRLFNGSDMAIGIAAKFFVLCDIDVSKVDRSTNPVFNSLDAPVIALLDAKGKLVSVLSEKISGTSLLRAMIQTFAKSGIQPAKISIGKSILKNIEDLENSRESAAAQCFAAKSSLEQAKKDKKASLIALLQRFVKKTETKLESVTKALAAQNKLWEDLFKQE
jgi:hypothetical protein